MGWFDADGYWWSRLILERGVAVVYCCAFLAAARQNRALIGEHGLTPAPRYLARRSLRQAPSVFQWRYTDRLAAVVAWTGLALAVALAVGAADVVPLPVAMAAWLLVWGLYLSIVNVGQIWYGFGWESLLLETGFLVVFLGNDRVAPPVLTLWLLRWLVFRVEFGAGLIKMRGDPCWRDLTCLYYHHETQPMPGPLSWWFHHLPRPLHRVEAAANHVAQLIVPFGLFAPQPVATWAAGVVIVTQAWLLLSGNFAWLNWLTLLAAFAAVELGAAHPAATASPVWFRVAVCCCAVLVVVLSYLPARNLLSRQQRMNQSYNRFHLVNSYGAFGVVSRQRYEVVIEGTGDEYPSPESVWHEYRFKGKPGALRRRPRQWAPYHLRLDWLMWFAALSPGYAESWFRPLLARLLTGDPDTLRLLAEDPFAGSPPRFVRARLYHYRFSSFAERRREHAWWVREPAGSFYPVTSIDTVSWR